MNDAPATPSALQLTKRTASTGLSAAEVTARVERGEANAVTDASSRSLWSILSANLFTLFNLVIAVGAVVLLVLGRWQDALFSLAAVANVIIGVTQEFSAKRKLDRLALLHASRLPVLRDGGIVEVASGEIVLDDLVQLQRGDQVPADGVIVASAGFDVDESMLTGESDPVPKREGDTVLSGSSVVAGHGTMQAARVGESAYARKITEEAKRFSLVHSELRSSLDRVVKWISWVLVPLVLVVLNGQMQARGGWAAAFASGEWEDAVVRAIASVSASVPQGLILMTSIAFAVAAVKLARDQVLTQELAAVEGLARVDVVCLDKTGTITDGTVEFDTAHPIGSPREGWQEALAWFGADANANPTAAALRAPYAEPAPAETATVPFTSERRYSGVSFGEQNGTWLLGAPDALFPNRETHAEVRQIADSYADTGKRALVLAHSDGAISGDASGYRLPPDRCPVAVLVFAERVRDDAADTIAYFARQGVDLRILSGDSPRTVGAVARSVGIELDGDAYDANLLPDDPAEQAEVLEHNRVLGRVNPAQKQSIVRALQAKGHTVAMTGDGVNDALALKTADLGIAMGNGAQATKAVARLVLLDGKFSHLPKVVEEGRQVIANIERVSRIFLTKTAYAFLLAVIFGVTMMEFPFLPRQISATDGLTIGIPAFFLALMPNPKRYVPGFLKRSLLFCVPAGAVVASVVVAVTLYGRFAVEASTAAVSGAVVIALTIVGLWVLIIQSRPFNLFRTVIVAAMLVGLAACFAVPLLAQFFAIALPPVAFLAATVAIAVTGAVAIEIIHRLWQRKQRNEAPETVHASPLPT